MTMYVIVPVDEISSVMFQEAVQKEMDDLRKSIDSTKVVFKFNGETPDCFSGYDLHTHSEILAEMLTSEWTGEE